MSARIARHCKPLSHEQRERACALRRRGLGFTRITADLGLPAGDRDRVRLAVRHHAQVHPADWGDLLAINPTQRRLLAALPGTASEIAAALGRYPGSVSNSLRDLEARGIVRRNGVAHARRATGGPPAEVWDYAYAGRWPADHRLPGKSQPRSDRWFQARRRRADAQLLMLADIVRRQGRTTVAAVAHEAGLKESHTRVRLQAAMAAGLIRAWKSGPQAKALMWYEAVDVAAQEIAA